MFASVLLLASILAAPPCPDTPPAGPAAPQPLPAVTILDLGYFPYRDRTFTRARLAENREARDALACRYLFYPTTRANLGPAIEELDHLHAAWDALDWVLAYRNMMESDLESESPDPTPPHVHEDGMRQWLESLRDLIGPEAYYRGQMPAALPAWRFPDD